MYLLTDTVPRFLFHAENCIEPSAVVSRADAAECAEPYRHGHPKHLAEGSKETDVRQMSHHFNVADRISGGRLAL